MPPELTFYAEMVGGKLKYHNSVAVITPPPDILPPEPWPTNQVRRCRCCHYLALTKEMIDGEGPCCLAKEIPS